MTSEQQEWIDHLSRSAAKARPADAEILRGVIDFYTQIADDEASWSAWYIADRVMQIMHLQPTKTLRGVYDDVGAAADMTFEEFRATVEVALHFPLIRRDPNKSFFDHYEQWILETHQGDQARRTLNEMRDSGEYT